MTNVVDSLDQEYLAYSVLKSEFNWEAYACEIAVFFFKILIILNTVSNRNA